MEREWKIRPRERERERERKTQVKLSLKTHLSIKGFWTLKLPFLFFLGKVLREKTVGKGEKREKK